MTNQHDDVMTIIKRTNRLKQALYFVFINTLINLNRNGQFLRKHFSGGTRTNSRTADQRVNPQAGFLELLCQGQCIAFAAPIKRTSKIIRRRFSANRAGMSD